MEGEHQKLHGFVLVAELGVRPGAPSCHQILKLDSLCLPLGFVVLFTHLSQELAWTAKTFFLYFSLSLFLSFLKFGKTMTTPATLSAPSFLTFSWPSKEKPEAEGTKILDVSTVKSFPEIKSSYDNTIICTSWWFYSLPFSLACPDVPSCCYKGRLLLPHRH